MSQVSAQFVYVTATYFPAGSHPYTDEEIQGMTTHDGQTVDPDTLEPDWWHDASLVWWLDGIPLVIDDVLQGDGPDPWLLVDAVRFSIDPLVHGPVPAWISPLHWECDAVSFADTFAPFATEFKAAADHVRAGRDDTEVAYLLLWHHWQDADDEDYDSEHHPVGVVIPVASPDPGIGTYPAFVPWTELRHGG